MSGGPASGLAPGGSRRWAWVLVAAGLAVAVVLAPDLRRVGYSPDEEFTLFAVRGITAHGLPLLPSGLLYDRGLGYSYAAWLAGLALGQTLTAYRVVSMASAALALAVLFVELRRITSAGGVALAVTLAATSMPFWVSASTARFYAPFLLFYLLVLAVLARRNESWRLLVAVALASACARWTHELAFTLGALPLAGVILAARQERRMWLWRLGFVCGGLVAGQVAIVAVHALAPPSNGDVMIRRFFLWQVLNLFERPPLDLVRLLPAAAVTGTLAAITLAALRRRADPASALLVLVGGVAAALGQVAIAPVAAFALLPIVAPDARRRLVAAGVAVAALATVFWIVSLAIAGMPVGEAASRVTDTSVVYPLDMFSYLVRESPVLIHAVLALMLIRAAGLGGMWSGPERALHALWIGWVLWFGVIESGITARYLLLPVTFMLCALAVDLRAVWANRRGWPRPIAAAVATLLCLAVTAESWGWLGGDPYRAERARPTYSAGILGAVVQADDLIACTDELACVQALGRADAWLALDGFFRERFVVMRNGQPTGTYTGAPAAFSLTPLLEQATREQRRLVVFETLRDVPGYGSTAALVTRQLAREDLRGEVLGDALGGRLIHVTRAPDSAVARAER